MEKDYRLTITVFSDAGHPPIGIQVSIPEALALLLMATPVNQVSLGIEKSPGIIVDKSKLLDFR